MARTREGMTGDRCWQILAWSALVAGSLLLASLFQAVSIAATSDGAVRSGFACDVFAAQPLYAGRNTWISQTYVRCAYAQP
jgi:hypothetical protein